MFFWNGIFFLHAHPRVIYFYYTCVKFHQYWLIRLGEVALTRNIDRHTGWSVYPIPSLFAGYSCCFFRVRLLSVLRGHSRASISLFNVDVKQRNYWYHFYNIFGMTQPLTGDWTPAGYREGGAWYSNNRTHQMSSQENPITLALMETV